MMRTGPIVLAAGGTGGHVFPAQALSTELKERGIPQVLATDVRGRQYGTSWQVPCEVISSATPGGKSPMKMLMAAWEIARGFLQARRILEDLDARLVTGFGGYPALPTVLAAQSKGIPTVLHEQNALLGRANRLLARRASMIAASFPDTRAFSTAQKPPVEVVGNPVRAAVRDVRDVSYQPIRDDGEIRLLVMGGSQGARILSDVLPRALAGLPEMVRQRLVLTQQCRAEDIDRVRAIYTEADIRAELSTFIEDVPQQLADCHLAITRAGASTVAEVACVGRPALLLPYPHATDDHQAVNAQALVDAGGAVMVRDREFQVTAVQDLLQDLLSGTARLQSMATAARAFGRPDAARALADRVIALLQNTSLKKGEAR